MTEGDGQEVRKAIERARMRDVEAPGGEGMETTAGASPDLRRHELLISLALRVGVLSSSALMVVGLPAVMLSFDDSQSVTSSLFASAGAVGTLTSPTGVLARLWQGDASAVTALGLFILMLTPIAQVLFSLVSFWQERDRPFILIASCALAILVLSLLWAR